MKSFSNPHGFIFSLKRDYFTFIVKNNPYCCNKYTSVTKIAPVRASSYPVYGENNI